MALARALTEQEARRRALDPDRAPVSTGYSIRVWK
jgi:hypothetical protein